ncbi:hypothetical protein [Eudoraea adriatica]|uniref:hypothetical protein n=1 Tax=Eudoraea adriatica TaxID=446681 RepID=UPI000361832C|nr:hypothetical protein [Eudoraea adriatica]
MTTYEKYKLILMVIFGAVFLTILYQNAWNGRFEYHNQIVFDTITGEAYIPEPASKDREGLPYELKKFYRKVDVK